MLLVPPCQSAVIAPPPQYAPVQVVAGLIRGPLLQEIRAAQAIITGSTQVPVRNEIFGLIRWKPNDREPVGVYNLRSWSDGSGL